MAARRSFLSTALRVGNAVARQHAAAVRLQAAAEARAAREQEREQRRQAMDDKRRRLQHSELEAKRLNDDLTEQINELTSLLSVARGSAGFLNFEALKYEVDEQPFTEPALAPPEPEPVLDAYLPSALQGLLSLLPWARRMHAEASLLAQRRFEQDLEDHRAREGHRIKAAEAASAEAWAAYDRNLEEERRATAAYNAQIDAFASQYAAADPAAVADYCRLILENCDYPQGIPKQAKTAYIPESKQLIVEYACPAFDVIPEVASYRFVKAKHEIVTTQRPASQRRELYSSVIAQIALSTLDELFAADRAGHLETIVFNGHVDAIDKGTGRRVYPCILSVRTSREIFTSISLGHVEPLACLKTLNAAVSARPNELVPVRPVIQFDMVDSRFVEEADILSGLDQRPNLMELSPSEFESLITNLFEKMGLETRQTQASRDGGVDCVAYDPRPIFGGKVVIQAKRYKNTVGVSAVRDLFGTMQNEGASKGILVTTSGYGKAAFDFANGKPLELLGGSHLLYLLEQHAGVIARIETPESWKDPTPDSV